MEITQNALPFGLHEKTSEGLSAKKSYASPTIKIVEFVVEVGLEGSVDPHLQGSQVFRFDNQTTAYQTESTDGWAYDYNWF